MDDEQDQQLRSTEAYQLEMERQKLLRRASLPLADVLHELGMPFVLMNPMVALGELMREQFAIEDLVRRDLSAVPKTGLGRPQQVSQGESEPIAGREQTADPSLVLATRVTFFDDRHREHMGLFEQVLKATSLDKWIGEHKTLSRTAVTDYRGGRINGRISSSKRAEIEAAIAASALRLSTRTHSD